MTGSRSLHWVEMAGSDLHVCFFVTVRTLLLALQFAVQLSLSWVPRKYRIVRHLECYQAVPPRQRLLYCRIYCWLPDLVMMPVVRVDKLSFQNTLIFYQWWATHLFSHETACRKQWFLKVSSETCEPSGNSGYIVSTLSSHGRVFSIFVSALEFCHLPVCE